LELDEDIQATVSAGVAKAGKAEGQDRPSGCRSSSPRPSALLPQRRSR